MLVYQRVKPYEYFRMGPDWALLCIWSELDEIKADWMPSERTH